jgi:catechol 2,3-dioxygenase-like lactoylglutathione lyase family enzyme
MRRPRGIDHLVIAMKDLDAGARFYESLGFQVGGRNRHPWGTENRIVQLDGSFLELITVGEGADIPDHGPESFSFGAYVRDFLAEREGFAMLVLDSHDAEADSRRFASAGLGDLSPFHFARSARRPDEGEIRVAFTLAFTRTPASIGAAFFVCQQHHPENFWNRDFQVHPNHASAIGSVTLTTTATEEARVFLETFGDAVAALSSQGWSLPLARGRVELRPTGREEADSVKVGSGLGRLTAFSVVVADVESMAERLAAAGIPHEIQEGRTIVGPDVAAGVAIAFERG